MEPKSGPRMHWSWPFSSTVAGTHPFCIPLIPWENVVSPQGPDCYISFLARASPSPPPSPKVQPWFYYPCWKTPLARTVFQEAQFLGVSFKALCSLASAVSPLYSPTSTLGCPWHTGLAAIPCTCHMWFHLHTFACAVAPARNALSSSTPPLFPSWQLIPVLWGSLSQKSVQDSPFFLRLFGLPLISHKFSLKTLLRDHLVV